MKKVFKFLPICAGLLTLASCNSDDLFEGKGNVDLSNKIVMEITDGDAVTTRSTLTSGGGIYWDASDVIRAYDSKLQKYDNFAYDPSASAFTLDADPQVDEVNGVLDYTYVLYGVDSNNISYAGWKNDGEKGYNLALLKIMDSYEYEEVPASVNGVVTYKNIVPRYGKVTEGSVVGKSFKTTVFMLTGLARVRFENGNGLGVEKVRARAVNFKDEESKASFEKLELKQQAKASETYEKSEAKLITDEDAPKLNGWFEAVLDEGLTDKDKGQGLKPTDALINNEDASNVIEVTVPEGAMEDFTSAIFFPIVSGTYDLILFEYCVDDEWYYIGKHEGEVKKGESLNITPAITAAFDIEDEVLIPGKDTEAGGEKYVGLQSYLENYAKYNKSLTINVAGDLTVGSGTSKTEFIELNVPQIAEGCTLTLNIDGKITTEGSPLTISGNVGEGELVINYRNAEQAAAPAIVVTASGNVALNSSETSKGYGEAITVNKAGNMTLNGKFGKAVNIENVSALVLGGEFAEAVTAPESMNGDITLAGEYKKGATLKTTGDITVNAVTVDQTGNAKMILEATNITIAGTIGTLETTGNTIVTKDGDVQHTWTHNSGNLTVKGKGTVGTVSVKGGVLTISEGGYIRTLSLDGATSATITGNGTDMNKITTKGVPVTLNDVVVSAVEVTAPIAGEVGIILNGGTVNTLKGYTTADATKTTVKSVGTVDIKAVTNDDNLKFTSEINDETKAVAVADAETVNIYTGAQLLALQGASTLTSVKTINLNTNVTATNVEWTPSNILYNKATTFNGNEHEIGGLKIVKNGNTTTNIAFFSRINNTNTVTVKELKLSGLTYDGEATANVAGLVGTVTSSVTIDAVDIVGKKLYGVDEVNNVGGLIARASNGDIIIENTTVTFEEIAGKQYVGGLIGDDYSATSSHTAEITVMGGENALVTVTKLTSSYDATTKNIATFGMLVGAVRSVGTTLTITGEKLYNKNLIAGNRDKYLYDQKTYSQDGAIFKFMGVEGNYIGFSSAYDYTENSSQKDKTTKVTIGDKNYTWNELNKFDFNWVN